MNFGIVINLGSEALAVGATAVAGVLAVTGVALAAGSAALACGADVLAAGSQHMLGVAAELRGRPVGIESMMSTKGARVDV